MMSNSSSIHQIQHMLTSRRYLDAIENCKGLLIADPGNVQVLFLLGLSYFQIGDWGNSISAYSSAMQFGSKDPSILLNRGISYTYLGDFTGALSDFKTVLRVDERNFLACCYAGISLFELKNYEDALEYFDKSISLNPFFAHALYNKAKALSQLGKTNEAVAFFIKASQLEPRNFECFNNLGNCYRELRAPVDALASYEKAIALKPDYAEAYNNRGNALRDLKRPDEALASYERSIAFKPDYAEAFSNRGGALYDLNHFDEALASYDKAISLKADQESFYASRGSLLREMGRENDALEDYSRELRIAASRDTAAELIVQDCVKLLSVDKIPAIYSSEEELQNTRERVETVLDDLANKYQSRFIFNELQLDVCRKAVRHLNGFYLAYHQKNDRETMKKLSFLASKLLNIVEPQNLPVDRNSDGIRVGIASHKLRDHNGANWAYNWINELPKKDYEFFTYNFDFANDDLAESFSSLGTHRELKFLPETQQEIVAQMRNDRLDFLMLPDVGMAPVSRFLSLHRIAPRQFTAWGHPVTTGSTQMDYFLSSDLMEPVGGQDHYSEQLTRMPNLALYLQEKRESRPGKRSFGLPEGRVLFGCLQSLFKYLPRYDEILPRIAQQVPQALFVFLEGQSAHMTDILTKRLQLSFEQYALEADRHIVFLPRQKPADYDSLLACMDISIDSVGWSGGNTSLKAIEYCVPLVTLPGTYMRGRHTYAMFKMMNTDELIVASIDEYVERLVKLGKERDYRHYCSSLFNDNKFKLYEDQSFIDAFDEFLKFNCSR